MSDSIIKADFSFTGDNGWNWLVISVSRFSGKVSPIDPTNIVTIKIKRMKSSRQQMFDATSGHFRIPGDCSPQVKLWRIKRLSLYKINMLKPGGK